MPHGTFEGITDAREGDHAWFDPCAQQGLFSMSGSLEKVWICAASVCLWKYWRC